MIQGSEAEMCDVDYWEAELHGRLLSCCCLRFRGGLSCPCWLCLGRQEFQQRLVRSNDRTVYR